LASPSAETPAQADAAEHTACCRLSSIQQQAGLTDDEARRWLTPDCRHDRTKVEDMIESSLSLGKAHPKEIGLPERLRRAVSAADKTALCTTSIACTPPEPSEWPDNQGISGTQRKRTHTSASSCLPCYYPAPPLTATPPRSVKTPPSGPI
jgi:hypothetical protein